MTLFLGWTLHVLPGCFTSLEMIFFLHENNTKTKCIEYVLCILGFALEKSIYINIHYSIHLCHVYDFFSFFLLHVKFSN